ncbi:MAG: hypothetical protein ACYDBQ_03040 [Thermoplasmatota archaeon]
MAARSMMQQREAGAFRHRGGALIGVALAATAVGLLLASLGAAHAALVTDGRVALGINPLGTLGVQLAPQ